MKHNIMRWLCLVLAFCLLGSSVAYAANETAATMTVTYTQEAPEPSETESPNDTPTEEMPTTQPGNQASSYEIDIPSEISLNDGDSTLLMMNSLNIGKSFKVVVYIDGDRTFQDDGFLHLTAPGNDQTAKTAVYRYNSESDTYERLSGDGEHEVAVFKYYSLNPNKYGLLRFEIENQSELEPGTYSGTVYFSIRMAVG